MDNLLVTKLIPPPSRKKLVPRLPLIRKLNEEWQDGKKLILLSAPAGYGKTTLLIEWLQSLSTRTAWLSLDEADNDPARLLAYLFASLESVTGKIPIEANPEGGSPQPSAESLLTAMINTVAAIPEAVILVLDDYQAIHNPGIHQQIAFLLERLPPQMLLALLTREDPLLPIPRLRAKGQVLEIRQDDLRFSFTECADFLHLVMGLPLENEDVALLERRTEGWIAGLQLAALSMQGRSDLSGFIQAFSGSNRFILDYLMDEVFDRQSQEVQDFLLETSILERFSAPLCDAVRESAQSQRLLEFLEQENLFLV